MVRLFDVSVLVALFDINHSHHAIAQKWLEELPGHEWATCSITANGFVRILSNPNYPNVASTAWEIADRLEEFQKSAGLAHHFWSDQVSITDRECFNRSLPIGPSQITDLVLLALATRHRAVFSTFDTRIDYRLVRGAQAANLEVIPQ